MTMKLFAAALAALTLVTAGAASAQDFRRGDRDRDWGDRRGRAEIVVRKDGRVMSFDRGDRMFYRLIDRPYNFRPGLTYAYTDRCNRQGCIAFVFDGRHRRFYLLPGQGRNLVYVNDQPVMSPQELSGGEEILLGQTKLRFVPFCGKSFDWYQK